MKQSKVNLVQDSLAAISHACPSVSLKDHLQHNSMQKKEGSGPHHRLSYRRTSKGQEEGDAPYINYEMVLCLQD